MLWGSTEFCELRMGNVAPVDGFGQKAEADVFD
jgi:hypothetical protein